MMKMTECTPLSCSTSGEPCFGIHHSYSSYDQAGADDASSAALLSSSSLLGVLLGEVVPEEYLGLLGLLPLGLGLKK